MAKDKFKQLQQGGVGSFQDTLVQAATTVAAIEKQQEQQHEVYSVKPTSAPPMPPVKSETPRFMRLPNPQIPLSEYNLVQQYISSFDNMTRQDFVELAIIEKLHNDGVMSQEDFDVRFKEIRDRLPRGQRKGTKTAPK